MDDVVPCREQHQHHDDGKPDAEPDLLGPVAQGAAAQRLDSVEQKVPAIEQRDREQVDQADRHRERFGELAVVGVRGADDEVRDWDYDPADLQST